MLLGSFGWRVGVVGFIRAGSIHSGCAKVAPLIRGAHRDRLDHSELLGTFRGA